MNRGSIHNLKVNKMTHSSMPHASFATEQSHTSHWLKRRINFDLIRDLCETCWDLLKASELGTESGSLRRSNGRRTLDLELRIALLQVADLELILDPIPEDEADTVEGKELRGLLSEVCQFIEGIPLHFGLDQNRRCGEDENLEAILARLRGSTTHLSEVVSNRELSPKLFAYDSKTALTQEIIVVKEFNRFLLDLKQPVFDSDGLVDEPPENATRAPSVGKPLKLKTEVSGLRHTDEGCERCIKHAQAAIKAIFSRLSACGHREAMVHRMLVQLPGVEEITSRHNCSNNFALEMFLSDCPESYRWQEAQITRISISQIGTPGPNMPICEAIREALDLDGGLQFHIQEHLSDVAENDFRVPWYDYLRPQHDQMKPTKSIWDLLKAGYLDWLISARHLRSSASMTAPLIKPNERRSLAIQIVFGIVLCFRYDSILSTWDSKRVYVLAPADGPENLKTPYVSCVEKDADASELDLPDPDVIRQGTNTSLSRTFTKMAKALLEIGLGECLDEYDADSNDDSQHLKKRLWEMVQNFNRYSLKCTDGIDSLDKLPYIAAAERCLCFENLYRLEVINNSVGPREIVEKIVTGKIISKLLENQCANPVIRTMDTVIRTRHQTKEIPSTERRSKASQSASRCSIGASCPVQQKVMTLFDNSTEISNNSILVSRAETFFGHMKDFHNSFKCYVDGHGTPPNQPIRIAILDTGIDKNHVGIHFDGEHMKDEWCISFVGDDNDFHDNDGHGTHCASLLQKVAPDAEIYILKVFSRNEFDLKQARNISKVRRMLAHLSGCVSATGLASMHMVHLRERNAADKNKAIRHAVKLWDVHVISMSFGLRLPSSNTDMPEWRKVKSEIEREIDLARPRLLFAAASNEGKNQSRAFPSTIPSVFCVHASDGNGNDCGINPHHDEAQNNIMILGTGIRMYDERAEDFVYKEGTSFATAIAAGLAACILDLTSRVPTRELHSRSKAMLRTYEGIRILFRYMSGPERSEPRPFIVPWNFWVPKYWTVDSRGLDRIWSQLDSDFNEAEDHVFAKMVSVE